MNNPSLKHCESRKFRLATPDDTAHCVRLLVPLYEKVGGIYGIPLDLESLTDAVLTTIQTGICIVGPVACAGGLLFPFPWNRNALVGYTLFWNYTKPSGVKILPALMDEFRRRGATQFCAISHFPENKAARIYRRFGLRKSEISHNCALSQ